MRSGRFNSPRRVRDGERWPQVPFTAFHPVPVWLLCMWYPRRFDFIALTVGAVVPDLFEPFVLLGFIGPEWGQFRCPHSPLPKLTRPDRVPRAAPLGPAGPLLHRADGALRRSHSVA